jgi:hypothetical protein
MNGPDTTIVFVKQGESLPRSYSAEQFSVNGRGDPQLWDEATVLAWLRWHVVTGRLKSMTIQIEGAPVK